MQKLFDIFSLGLLLLFFAAIIIVPPMVNNANQTTIEYTVDKEAKPQMIYFSMDGCPPCQYMKKLFKDKDVKNLLDKMEIRYYHREMNPDKVREYGVRLFPTMFFVDSNGVSKKYVGAMNKEKLINILQSLNKS